MRKRNLKVAQIDAFGRVKVWNSIDDICERMNCSYGNLNAAINNGITTFGCTWQYVTSKDAKALMKSATGTIREFRAGWTPKTKSDKHGGARKAQMLVQTTKNGQFVGVYRSYYNAEKMTGICNQEIWNAANGRKKYAGGYKWMKVQP